MGDFYDSDEEVYDDPVDPVEMVMRSPDKKYKKKTVKETLNIKKRATESIKEKIVLSKLRGSFKRVITQKPNKRKTEDTIDLAETALDNAEREIVTLSYNRFAINKVKRLKAAGKTFEEIDEMLKVLSKLRQEDSAAAEAKKNNSKNFFTDYKFFGMSAREVLKKVNAITGDSNAEESKEKEKKPAKPKKEVKSKEDKSNDSVVNKQEKSIIKDDSKKDALKLKINPDVITPTKVEKTNEDIYNHLLLIGETQIANYISDMMNEPKSETKYVSEIRENTDELRKISQKNTDMESHLARIEYLLRDQQDIEIESIEDKLEERAIQEEKDEEVLTKNNAPSFLSTILSALFGGAMWKLLMGKSVLNFGIGILKQSLGWLQGVLGTWVKSISSALIKKTKDILDASIRGVKAIGTKALSKITGFLGRFAILRKGWDAGIKAIASLKAGLGRVTGFLGDKFAVFKKTKAVDVVKKATVKTAKSAGNIAKKSGKGLKVASKAVKVGSVAAKVTGNSAKFLGLLKPFLKVLKPIPFLGQAIMAGSALYSGYDGYKNASGLYGVPEEDISTPAKIFSGVASAIEDFIWPIPISKSFIAEQALKLTGQSVVKKESVNKELDGIVSKNPSGNWKTKAVTGAAGAITGSTGSLKDNNSTQSNNGGSFFGGVGLSGLPTTEYIGNSDVFDPNELGNISGKYESGGRGVSTISTGAGDAGGVSYGKFQIASKTGTMGAFLKSSEGSVFASKLKGSPGSKEFNESYSALVNSDGEAFHKAQHAFIKRTHYVPVKTLADSLSINTANKAIQEALWSQSVQHGLAGNKKILEAALASGVDLTDDIAVIKAIYLARGNYVSSLSSVTSSAKSSILNRYSNEMKDVLSVAGGSLVDIGNASGAVANTYGAIASDYSLGNISGASSGSFSSPNNIPSQNSPNLSGGVVNVSSNGSNVGMVADFRTGEGRTKEESVMTFSDSHLSLDGIAPDTKKRFLAMAEEYFTLTGKKIQVNSTFRDFKKQEELYKSMAPGMAAKPGNSMHNYGYAIDIQSAHADELDKLGLFNKYKFHRPIINKERWHVEDATIDRVKVRTAGAAMYASGQVPGKPESAEAQGESELTTADKQSENIASLSENSSNLTDPIILAAREATEPESNNAGNVNDITSIDKVTVDSSVSPDKDSSVTSITDPVVKGKISDDQVNSNDKKMPVDEDWRARIDNPQKYDSPDRSERIRKAHLMDMIREEEAEKARKAKERDAKIDAMIDKDKPVSKTEVVTANVSTQSSTVFNIDDI